MPLHLLGKKSWNVYNADNIARVKADEAAAAARETADEQRMQELDAERRAAILRGQIPPPLPEEHVNRETGHRKDKDRDARGRDKKRRRLAGEDETAMEIRLATSVAASKDDSDDYAKILNLRSTASDAPLTNYAGNIDLFPVDLKETAKRDKNEEAEAEKKRKERALGDQYTMRFANAAGFKTGLSQPWYATGQKPSQNGEERNNAPLEDLDNKNVWGDEDPRRKEREYARMTSNDPLAFMQKAQAQLKKSNEDKRKWAEERDQEVRELRAAQEREERKRRHYKRKTKDENVENHMQSHLKRSVDSEWSKKRKHRHRSRSGSQEKKEHRFSHQHKSSRSRNRSRECCLENRRENYTFRSEPEFQTLRDHGGKGKDGRRASESKETR